MEPTAPLTRAKYRTIRLTLLLGLSGFWTMSVALTLAGIFPVELDDGALGPVVATCSTMSLLTAWFWARPRLSRRPPTLRVDDFWRRQETGSRALLVLFLFEGSAILAMISTVVSGAWPSMALSTLAMLGIVLHGPERVERVAL